jgi:[histone H3]-lysine4/36 N-trimethyltransferase SMYD
MYLSYCLSLVVYQKCDLLSTNDTSNNLNFHNQTINHQPSTITRIFFVSSTSIQMTTTAPFVTKTSSNGYRSAHTLTSVKPGTIVSSETLFSSVLLRSAAHQYCATCFASATDTAEGRLKRCSGGCEYTYYCTRDCQIQDFGIHKHTCKKYSKIVTRGRQLFSNITCNSSKDSLWSHDNDFPYEDFMLGRKVYIKLCNDANIPIKEKILAPLPESLRQLNETVPSSDFCQVESALARVLADSFELYSAESLSFFESLLAKFRCNNFGIQSMLQEVIAHGIYPKGAILNHSCDPNAILLYEGVTQVIRAIKPLKEGDELFHSYTDLCKPTYLRQQHLQRTYGFICDCERCRGIGKWEKVEEELTKNLCMSQDDEMKVQILIQKAQEISLDSTDECEEELKRDYECLRDALSIQRKKLGKYNLERYKTECLALTTSMLLQGNENVLSHAQAAVDFLEFTCNEFHPLLILQKMTLAELFDGFGYNSKANEIYNELVTSCSVTYGKNHVYVQHYTSKVDRAFNF